VGATLDIEIVRCRAHARAGDDEGRAQSLGVLSAVAAAIDLAVIADHQQRIALQVELSRDGGQHGIGACGRFVPMRIARAALVVAGVIDLVEMDQDQPVLARGEPGFRRRHDRHIGRVVLAGGKETGIALGGGDHALEPVVAGDGRAQTGAMRHSEEGLGRQRRQLLVIEIDGRCAADFRIGPAEQEGPHGLGVGGRAGQHLGRGAQRSQPGEGGHELGVDRRVVAQRVDKHNDQALRLRAAGGFRGGQGLSEKWSAEGCQ
jgi:hypothetical protein